MAKKIDYTANYREFMHSLGRISDRMNQFEKDIKRFKKESFVCIKALCEDCRMIKEALDSLHKDKTEYFNDELKKGGMKNDEVD